MNVSYKEINCADAAKMVGCNYSTIAKWCKRNLINFVNVSNGNNNNRYLLTEQEVDYLKSLNKQFGINHMMKHYDKNWNVKEEPAIADEQELFVASNEEYEKSKVVPVIVKEDNLPTRAEKVDIDKIAITIGYIQDIKEKLNDLEAEKAQLLAELEELRKEVMDVL